MNAISAAPEAMTPTTVFGNLLPIKPLMTNPTAGMSGMIQIRSRKFIFSVTLCLCGYLPLHQIDLVDVHRFLVFEHRDHDPKTHCGFGRSDSDDKDSEDLTRHLLETVGKRNQVDIDGIHHQLDRHEDDHDVPASQNTDDADRKQRRTQH